MYQCLEFDNKRFYFKPCDYPALCFRCCPAIAVTCCLWFLALATRDAKSVSSKHACDKMLTACENAKRHFGKIFVAGVGKCSPASCAKNRS